MTGLSSWIVTLALVFAAGRAPKTDSREEVARAFFAAAKYQEAIDIYSQLFAQYVHPDYIYNIGRCYQNMGDPDKALQSFHEFSRKAKNISPELRKELDAHIKEMEALKAERDDLNSKLAVTEREMPAEAPPGMATSPGKRTGATSAGTSRVESGASSKPEPSSAADVDRYLARLRASPEKYWRERAIKVDEAKLEKTVALVKNAKPSDARLADYQLHLANQFAGKHFFLRVEELESKADGAGNSHKVTTGARKLGPEIASTFSTAAGYYLAVSEKKDFAKMDEVLLGLGVLLQANNMEERARNVLLQLLRSFPKSKESEAVRGAGRDD